MTMKRTRRNSRDQAGDALRKLLKAQQAVTAQCKVAYEEALASEQRTSKALESLGMVMLPGRVDATDAEPDKEAALLLVEGTQESPAEGRCPSCGHKKPWHLASCSIVPRVNPHATTVSVEKEP